MGGTPVKSLTTPRKSYGLNKNRERTSNDLKISANSEKHKSSVSKSFARSRSCSDSNLGESSETFTRSVDKSSKQDTNKNGTNDYGKPKHRKISSPLIWEIESSDENT